MEIESTRLRPLCYFPSNNVFVINNRKYNRISTASARKDTYLRNYADSWCQIGCCDNQRKGECRPNRTTKPILPAINNIYIYNSSPNITKDLTGYKNYTPSVLSGKQGVGTNERKLSTTETPNTSIKQIFMNEYQYAKEKSFLTLTSVSSSYRINAWKEDLSRKTHFLSDSHGIQRNFTNTNGKTTRKLKEIIDQECKVEEYLDAIPITNYISHHRRNYTCDTTEKGHITKETHSTEIDDRKKEIEKSLTDGSKDSRETGRNNLNVPKEKYKITKGRPTHRYCAKTHDIIDKELEIWHNSHNSTLKWERIKSGLYLVGGSKVNLIKTNGILYVKSGEHRKNFDKMHIAKFVEEKQFCQSKKRI